MSRRDFLRRSLGASLAAMALERLPAAEAERPMPNLVWIMTDQQPPNTCRIYGNGHVQTPVTDRLAARGTRLDNFHISAFPCGPSRSCMITGREAHNTGVLQNDVTLPADVPSLAELLAGAGYDMAWFGKWHLGGNMYRRGEQDGWEKVRRPDDGGFAYEQRPGGTGEDEAVHGFTARWRGGWRDYHRWIKGRWDSELVGDSPRFGNHSILASGPEGSHIYSRVPAEHHVENFLAAETAAFVRERAGADRPFGAVLSFYGPHLPVAPPQPWDEKYALAIADPPANHVDRLVDKPMRQRNNSRCYMLDQWGEEQYRDYIRRYWGFVDYIEDCAQQVLDALDETGATRDTIVLWTSDHGDMVGAHGMIFKLGACGYDELMRVPMVMSYPGVIEPGAASGALAASADLVPTIIDLIGLPQPAGLDGRSFKPVLTGEAERHRDVVVCNWMGQGLAIRNDTHKLVYNHSPRDLDELYDLQADPGELHNLAASVAARPARDELFGQLDAWMQATGHPYAGVIREQRSVSAKDDWLEVRPKVTEFTPLGGRRFRMAWEWAVDAPLRYAHPCWAFAQFMRGRQIAFKQTAWSETPTTEWDAGDVIPIGPVEFEVPAGQQGEFDLRLGLWDPERRTAPGIMIGRGASSNAFVLYTLRVTGDGEAPAMELIEQR